MSILKTWKNNLEKFFFAEEIPYGIAIIRIFLPLVLLLTIIHRWPYAREIYSADGATAQLWVNMGFTPDVPELSGNACVWLFTLLGLSLFTSSIGWCTRLSLGTSFVLYTYFSLMDSLSTMTKYNVIADHMLLLLTLSPCGKVWSIDSWLETRHLTKEQKLARKNTHPIWTQRLIQILIGVVYFGAGATKIQTPAFFNGDQMKYWMVTHFNYEHPFGELMVLFPGFLAFSGFIVLVWELAFIFLVWRKFERLFCIGLGVIFHLMTSLMLGLYTFPCVCFSTYLSFLTTEDIEKIKAWWSQRITKSVWARTIHETFGEIKQGIMGVFYKIPAGFWNPLMLGVIVPVICTTALFIEFKQDRFGLNRPEGKYHLKQLDRQVVEQMMMPTEKLRETDKIFSFNVGVLSVCDNVFDCRPYFKQGTTILAQAALTPPHGDLYIECNLHNEQGMILSQANKFVTREEARATFSYQLCNNNMPGKYELVLKCNGTEVERRQFELMPNGKQAKVFAVTSR